VTPGSEVGASSRAYRAGLASDVARLLDACETIAAVGGAAGQAAPRGILAGIRQATGRAAKTR